MKTLKDVQQMWKKFINYDIWEWEYLEGKRGLEEVGLP